MYVAGMSVDSNPMTLTPGAGARNTSCQLLSAVFCTGFEYVSTRDGSGTNPDGDVLTKKSYCGCVKPVNGVENLDMLFLKASLTAHTYLFVGLWPKP